MKKYCIFAAQFLPHMGGVENYTYNISKELIKRGNKVTVVTNNTTGSVTREKMEGIEILIFLYEDAHTFHPTYPISHYGQTNDSFHVLYR